MNKIKNAGFKHKGKLIKIEDFTISNINGMKFIKWKNIEDVMGKRIYKPFCQWMNGQTCFKDGVYLCDVENFLRKPLYRFFD